MKKIFNFVLLFFPIMLFAQSGTTLDEYKYMTKGYAYQKEMGLDGGKIGYDLQLLFTASNGIEFWSLLKEKSELKGVLVILDSKSQSPIYLGLPTNGSPNELKGLAESDARENLNLNEKDKYDQSILEFAMFQLDGGIATNYIGETEKNLKGESTPQKEQMVEEFSTVVPLKVGKREHMTERSGMADSEGTPINNNVITESSFKERALIQLPMVRGLNTKKGTVVIKMCIDIEGNVKTAKFTQRGSTTFNKTLRNMAIDAAQKTKFSEGVDPEECGTITFKFQ